MELDPKVCERARLSRDARFDGRFFIGVVTTGVYCRPVCPVQPPKAKNVRFYPSAASAGEAGFRPCLRCRPEASPGTPAWLGTSATVSRALRLIADGVLDDGGVEELAEALGVGSRHLRRLFIKHLGATPIAVAQTRRLHFAKKLIDETDLSMADVALCSGFGSIRRFNAVFSQVYDRTPGALRKSATSMKLSSKPSSKPSATASLQPFSQPSTMRASAVRSILLRLPYRPPMDWDSIAAFLAGRATPGVEHVGENCYSRTISMNGQAGTIEVRPVAGKNHLELKLRFPDLTALFKIVERVKRIFDLGADPAEIASHLVQDARLAPLVRAHPGLRVPGAWDGFELAVRAILGQQVSVKAATTLAGRIARACGEPLNGLAESPLAVLFPTAEALAKADLTKVGVIKSRAAAIRTLARAVCKGEISFASSDGMEKFGERLTSIAGIGEWTAQYVGMRALGEPDAFPATDLGLLKALANGSGKATPGQLRSEAESWRPWRAYAAMHLWKSYATMLRPPKRGS